MTVKPVKTSGNENACLYIFDNSKRYYIERENSACMRRKQTDSKCIVLGVRIIYTFYYLHVL